VQLPTKLVELTSLGVRQHTVERHAPVWGCFSQSSLWEPPSRYLKNESRSGMICYGA